MTAFANHFVFEFKTGLRNSTSLLMNYLFPLGFYALMGLVMTEINPTFSATLIPAMILFAAMASALLGLPGPLVESREAGIYRSFKINGVPAISILTIPTISTIFHALIVAVIISLTGSALFGGTPPVDWGSFTAITLVVVLVLGAIGALIGVIATGSRSTVLWSQLVFLPSMLLGGLMMPLDILPESVRSVSALLPTSHAMQAYLGFAYKQPTVFNPTISLIVLAVSGLIAFGLSIYLFNWDSRNSARRGHPLMALLVLVPYLIAAFIK